MQHCTRALTLYLYLYPADAQCEVRLSVVRSISKDSISAAGGAEGFISYKQKGRRGGGRAVVDLYSWDVRAMCVRSSDAEGLLLADSLNGLHRVHLSSSPSVRLLCSNALDAPDAAAQRQRHAHHHYHDHPQWSIVNLLPVSKNTLLLCEVLQTDQFLRTCVFLFIPCPLCSIFLVHAAPTVKSFNDSSILYKLPEINVAFQRIN